MQKILYIGMDVHQTTIVIVVLNAEGKTISEAIIETKTETVRDFMRGLRGDLRVTFEEGAQAGVVSTTAGAPATRGGHATGYAQSELRAAELIGNSTFMILF